MLFLKWSLECGRIRIAIVSFTTSYDACYRLEQASVLTLHLNIPVFIKLNIFKLASVIRWKQLFDSWDVIDFRFGISYSLVDVKLILIELNLSQITFGLRNTFSICRLQLHWLLVLPVIYRNSCWRSALHRSVVVSARLTCSVTRRNGLKFHLKLITCWINWIICLKL